MVTALEPFESLPVMSTALTEYEPVPTVKVFEEPSLIVPILTSFS